MNFRASPYVHDLRASGGAFLQALLTEFSLARSGRGALLSVHIGDDVPAISVREAKGDVQSRIPEFEAAASRLQQALDAFLVQGRGTALEHDDPSFPFRHASGGALPVLHVGDRTYYCMFHRDVYPIGWNIANGGTDTVAELLDPRSTVIRELSEELVVVDLDARSRYVFDDGSGRPAELPEFAALCNHWRTHNPSVTLDLFDAVDAPIEWHDGPDSLRVTTADGAENTVEGCYVNITALDFGIEVDRIAHLRFDDDVTLCDGELTNDRLLNRTIGLFDVDRTNDLVLHNPGATRFEPDRIFLGGKERLASALNDTADEFARHVAPLRSSEELDRFVDFPPDRKYDLCPVTRRVIQRHAES